MLKTIWPVSLRLTGIEPSNVRKACGQERISQALIIIQKLMAPVSECISGIENGFGASPVPYAILSNQFGVRKPKSDLFRFMTQDITKMRLRRRLDLPRMSLWGFCVTLGTPCHVILNKWPHPHEAFAVCLPKPETKEDTDGAA